MSDDNDKMQKLGPSDLLRFVPLAEARAQARSTTTPNERPSLSADTSVRVLPSTCPYGLCDGTGFFKHPVRVTHPDFGKLFRCDCKQLGETERAKARMSHVLATLEQDMGPELSAATLNNYDLGRAANDAARASMQAARDLCCSYVTHPYGWLYFFGPTGVGKSHLLAATARELAARYHLTATYASEPDLFRYLREGYARQQEYGDGEHIDADERMAALQRVDVLLIDDLGTAHRGKTQGAAASWADAQLIDLLYQRHLHERYTLITSNLDVDDLEFRVRSRINGRTNFDYAGRNQKLAIVNTDQRKGHEA